MLWSNWISFAIGAWLFVTGWIPALQGEWNMIIFGAAAALFGFLAYKSWQGIVNGLLGVWIFLSGIWFGLNYPQNFLLVGIAMVILGIWGATYHTHDVAHGTA
jgi:hypothetical protein